MLLADVNDSINQWLSEHPGILGSAAIVIGLIMLAIGIAALLTGKTTDKKGREMTGGLAYAQGAVLSFFGGLAVLFGLYKVATALF